MFTFFIRDFDEHFTEIICTPSLTAFCLCFEYQDQIRNVYENYLITLSVQLFNLDYDLHTLSCP